MACRRQRAAWVAGAKVAWRMGQPVPRRVLDVMRGVRCNGCGFTADGVGFGWQEGVNRPFCPKCRSTDLTLGEAK